MTHIHAALDPLLWIIPNIARARALSLSPSLSLVLSRSLSLSYTFNETAGNGE
jgi:hypothetical protein